LGAGNVALYKAMRNKLSKKKASARLKTVLMPLEPAALMVKIYAFGWLAALFCVFSQ